MVIRMPNMRSVWNSMSRISSRRLSPPPERHTVFNLSKYAGTAINRAHIGSCANGRFDDMRLAAAILKGRKVHSDVLLNITARLVRSISRRCVDEGIIKIFADAGIAFLPPPSCGMCAAGSNTPLGRRRYLYVFRHLQLSRPYGEVQKAGTYT